MILIIDNYDSFTWNLVQRIGELDPAIDVHVVRNDKITPAEAETLDPSHIIISPGPCTPREAGVSNDILAHFAGKRPVLGVCLGHQCIGHIHDMTVARHARIMHGKTSPIHHDAKGLFKDLPNPFTATRYHSLVVLRDSVPPDGSWEVSAWTLDTLDDGTIAEVVMGLRRAWPDGAHAPLEGVQFHPESFLTDEGPRLLANFLRMGGPSLCRYHDPMTTPSPPSPSPSATTKPHHARGVLAAQGEREIEMTVPDTDYRLTLLTYQQFSTPIGKRIVGIIQARARRVDVVGSGGSYVEPIFGQPRRIQGEILDTDASARTITVHAGAAPFVCTLSGSQRADEFATGDFVALDILEGTSFSQV